MAANNPLASAQQALNDQWQDAAYLLRNADHLTSNGYSTYAVELSCREMAERLDFSYDPPWSVGTRYARLAALSDGELTVSAVAEVPSVSMECTDTTANLDVSLSGTLSFSVAGASETVNAGDVALTPGASIKEGFVTLTRETGAATTADEYVVVGTNVAMARDFWNEISVADRLIILVYLTPFNLQPPG